MAEIKFTIPNDKLDNVLDGIDLKYPGRPQDKTKADWAKDVIKKLIIQAERYGRIKAAAEDLKTSIQEDSGVVS